MLDFKKECIVFIITSATTTDKNYYFKLNRPQIVPDQELTSEAKWIYEDMKKKELNNGTIDELLAIFIARNEQQYDEIMKKAEGFKKYI